MSFGSTIKKLRRGRELTQEELAGMLSISPQAVSRWETDAAMPDISLIPTLCNLFSVTSDELLGIDLERKREKISTVLGEASKYSSRGYLDKAAEILEGGLREFPDSYSLMRELMYVKFWQFGEDQSRTEYREEAVRLGEVILEKSTDDDLRESAIQVLCYSYSGMGRTEDAERMAKKASCIAVSSETLLLSIYRGDKHYKALQGKMLSLFQMLSNDIDALLWSKNDAGEFFYTDEEKAVLRDKRIAFINLFLDADDYGFYHCHLYEIYRDQSIYYARLGDTLKAVANLSAAAEHAVGFDTSDKNGEYKSLTFRNHNEGSWCTGNENNDSSRLLEQLDESVFDCIRDTPEFAAIREKLQATAGKWDVEESKK